MSKFFTDNIGNMLNVKISAEISVDKMRELYARLEDESTPHAVVVRKCRPFVKVVVIHCEANKAGYFKSILVPLELLSV